MSITVSNMFGRTVQISNDGIANVGEALAHYYGGSVPEDIKVALGGQDVEDMSTPVRDTDVLLVRTGQLAAKRQLSGA